MKSRSIYERETNTLEAIDKIKSVLKRLNVHYSIEHLYSSSNSDREWNIIKVSLKDSSGRVSSGIGKGPVDQCIASAFYESFEHLTIQNPEIFTEEEWRTTYFPDLKHEYSDNDCKDAAIFNCMTDSQIDYFTPFSTLASRISNSTEIRPSKYIPAAYADLSYSPRDFTDYEKVATGYRSSNGVASGATLNEALLHSLNELNERDSISNFLLSSFQKVPHGKIVSLSDIQSLKSLTQDIEIQFETELEIRQLESLWGYVVIALSSAFDSRGCRIIGAGSSLNCAYACERALAELVQNLIVEGLSYSHSSDGWPENLSRIEQFPYLMKAATLKDIPEPKDISTPDWGNDSLPVESQIDQVLDIVQNTDLKAYLRISFLDSKNPESISVCQVIIPGLERFHLVRNGIPIEPIGRFRNSETVVKCRTKITE